MSRVLDKSHAALRIVIVESNEIYRAGLRFLLTQKLPHIEVVDTDDLATGLLATLRPDPLNLVLIDLDLSTAELPALLKQAFDHAAGTRFAVWSAMDTRQCVLASLEAGFHGFLSKRQADDELLEAINDILSGQIYVPPSLARCEGAEASENLDSEVMSDLLITQDKNLPRLTPRQREVLFQLSLGKSNKEIARTLHIAEGTTKVHAAALLRAIGARNRTEAAFKAGKLLSSQDSARLLISSTATGAAREKGTTRAQRSIRTKTGERWPSKA